jgi:general secretion pathway protein G
MEGVIKLQKKLRRARKRRGMTLIEIIVVITILSLLTAAVAVAVIPRLEEAKRDRVRLDISAVKQGLDTYYAKKGKYPDTGAGLKALVDAQIMEKVPMDPWDHEYLYVLESGKPVITSYGKDGTPGGEGNDADISSKDSTTGDKK